MTRIHLILHCLLFPAIDSFGQKANLVIGIGRDVAFNIIAIDGVEVCQFVLSQAKQPNKHC
jgi:hypothetical protein